MQRLLRLAPALLGLGLLPSLPLACSTDAVGVQECREIELARCEAARSCDLGIDSDADFETCERYARDNCLHGLAVEATPKSAALSACVRTIEQAGACARAGKDLASECSIATYRLATVVSVCDIVEDPEEAKLCGVVLLPEEPESEAPDPTKQDAGAGDAGGD
jgi:hypothetical protein